MSTSKDAPPSGASKEPGEASGEEALIAARRSKAARVRQRGENPFANDVIVDDRVSVRQVRQLCRGALLDPPEDLRYQPEKVASLAEGKTYHLVGRITTRRGFGKASFLRMRDASGELQLFAKKDILGEQFAALEDIDIADHVEVSGQLVVTKTGELSVQLTKLRLLTKAMRPLPDKWHGLTDVDLRYRRRYVDMVANPAVLAVMQARALILAGLRDYLDGKDFVEVETPSLHTVIGGAAARPFTTHHNALDLELFLRIAPELYLKRLLVGGLERVYEIGRCYRNEGISTRHNPEFTMLEFYRAYATYEDLMRMTEEMLRHVDAYLEQGLERRDLGQQYGEWNAARTFTLDEPFQRVPLHAAIERALRAAQLPVELTSQYATLALLPDGKTADATRREGDGLVERYRSASERAKLMDWPNLRRALGVCESDGERAFVAYEYFAEPFLTQDYRSQDGSKSVPVFIIDYPFEVSPLARRKESEPSLTDRFELFVESRELCNAFSELNDPDDQAARFRDQVERKSRGAQETMDYDEDYVRALEHGMPPAAGFGMGVDRLVMTLCNQPSIRDVIAFPLLRPEAQHS